MGTLKLIDLAVVPGVDVEDISLAIDSEAVGIDSAVDDATVGEEDLAIVVGATWRDLDDLALAPAETGIGYKNVASRVDCEAGWSVPSGPYSSLAAVVEAAGRNLNDASGEIEGDE
jgi:hypothetical protein